MSRVGTGWLQIWVIRAEICPNVNDVGLVQEAGRKELRFGVVEEQLLSEQVEVVSAMLTCCRSFVLP